MSPNSSACGLVVAVLPVLVLACSSGEVEEWPKWQAGYERTLSEHLGEDIRIPRGIKEVGTVLPGQTDRCVTCHLGVTEPRLKDAVVEIPYRLHPTIPHSIAEFGCTICHRGDASATTKKEAHQGVAPRSEPMLPLEFVEGSCGQCHAEQVVAEAPRLTEGRRLIGRLGCTGCHEIPGFASAAQNAFDLNGLGSKVTRSWLIGWLENPRGWSSISTMPVYHLSSVELDQLADFLMSSKNDRLSRIARKIEDANGALSHASVDQRGREMLESMKCISCHPFEGRGGRLAQDLGWIGSKVKREWLFAWLKFPRKYFPDSRMPRYSFPDSDIHALAEHLLGSFKAPADALPVSMELESLDPDSVAAGRKLFGDSRCIGCHEREGEKRPLRLAPPLTGVGSRSPKQLEFGDSEVERTLAAWLRANVKEPHILNPNLRMPDFELSDLEADWITTALIGLTEHRLSAELMAPASPERSKVQPRGLAKEVFDRYQCLDCHTLAGRGEPLAMDLGLTGSKLRRSWLLEYLDKPYAIRPLLKERMPPFGMSAAEIRAVVDYFAEDCADSSLEDHPFTSGPIPEDLIERGRELYYDEYGCQACHILADSGGVYGPALDGAGERLRPGWIEAWLMDPRSLERNSRGPRYDISAADARALTAFISSQRQAADRDLQVEAESHLLAVRTPLPEWVTGGSRYEAQKGADVYAKYCVFCHGKAGGGDGPSVDRLKVSPTDFTKLDLMAALSRGQLVAAISGGGVGVEKSNLMPPYGKTLSSNQIDDVVTYIRTFIPLMTRFRYKDQPVTIDAARASLVGLEQQLAAQELFLSDATSEIRSGFALLKGEFAALSGDPTRARLLSDRLARLRQTHEVVLKSTIERANLLALNKVLGATGAEVLTAPGLASSYGATLAGFDAFNTMVEERGRELFAARKGRVSWELWKLVCADLGEGVFKQEYRRYLPELESVGLVKMTVELR